MHTSPLAWVAALCLLPIISGCGSAMAGRSSVSHDPLTGQSFYVDPANPAAQQAVQWRSEGHASEAAAISRIAVQPTATWFAGGGKVQSEVQALTMRAAEAGKSALLVAYDIPDRDCGSYSAGGAPSGAAYRRWIEQFAAGIGNRAATVILEPDAIPDVLTHCLSAAVRSERYALLRFAINTFKAHPQATVYLDAGNVGWIRPPARLIGPLRRAGIAKADGFALNVSNFYGTPTTVVYGASLSHELGGLHFVIDTGRNGNGYDTASADEPTWCNPPRRSLGLTPTTNTGRQLVDAYLWIKQPGISDGSCRPGEPRAGQWWPQYALELAEGGH
jgi:endoglucanase